MDDTHAIATAPVAAADPSPAAPAVPRLGRPKPATAVKVDYVGRHFSLTAVARADAPANPLAAFVSDIEALRLLARNAKRGGLDFDQFLQLLAETMKAAALRLAAQQAADNASRLLKRSVGTAT